MKNLSMHSCLKTLALAVAVSLPAVLHAEEDLLWKAVSTIPARVVPPYSGSGTPFPTAPALVVVSDTAILDEKSRQREEALTLAHSVFESGRALQIDVRALAVGGVVEGNLGPRVLINNQWLGVGGKVQVRQYRTQQIQEALKTLESLDPEAAHDMNSTVNAKLAAEPTMTLTVQKITSQSLVLKSPYSVETLKINTSGE